MNTRVLNPSMHGDHRWWFCQNLKNLHHSDFLTSTYMKFCFAIHHLWWFVMPLQFSKHVLLHGANHSPPRGKFQKANESERRCETPAILVQFLDLLKTMISWNQIVWMLVVLDIILVIPDARTSLRTFPGSCPRTLLLSWLMALVNQQQSANEQTDLQINKDVFT